MREINGRGLALVKAFEGVPDGDPSTVNLDPYLDPVGIWTIGWGHAIIDPLTRKFIRGADPEAEKRAQALYPDGITMEQAEALLTADLLDSARDVALLVKTPLTNNQFSALVSFDFNADLRKAPTMLRLLNEGNYIAAAQQFGRWVYGTVGGRKVKLNGLRKRREEEMKLFLKEDA